MTTVDFVGELSFQEEALLFKSELHLGDPPLPPFTGCVVKRVLGKANGASTGIWLQGDLAVTL